MTYTIVGVTGHIDHGKTTLVRVLTGVDTDTDPEEKRRGITIDLGFAAFQEGEHRFALIDAPGHQKYIGNLLAGVSAIDIGLLVVACDQGIQEQTLEHAAVVKALGVRNLIVVISRIDLVDESAVEVLSEELEVFLADFGFKEFPIVPISSVTGVGIERLKSLLCAFAARGATASDHSVENSSSNFRMPVDRVFTVPGRGLVVAGTIWSGEVHIGDMLVLAGTDELLRVRELENHGEFVESSRVGYRTAINLAGVGNLPIKRGDELVTPGTLWMSDQLVVALDMFPDTAEMRTPATVQMHSATQCCAARIVGVKTLRPGTELVVVVEPEQPIVASYRQACLFRRPYPVGSFASGRVLAAIPNGSAKTKNLVELGHRLKDAGPTERLSAWVDFLGEMKEHAPWRAIQLGISDEQFDASVQEVLEKKLAVKIGKLLVSVATANRARQLIREFVADRTHSSENAWMAEAAIVERARSVASSSVITWAIERLLDENQLVSFNNLIAIASERTVLSKKQRLNMDQITKLFAETRSPPTLKEAATQLGLSVDYVTSLVRFASQQRLLIDLGQGLNISAQVFGSLCRELRLLFERERELSVAAIRDCWQVTRKHAIPLLEFCDREGITIRRENVRTVGPRLDQYCAQESFVEQSIEQD